MEIASKNSTRLRHKWIIKNYNFFYVTGFSSPTFIQSDTFSVSINEKTCKFFLRLYPNKIYINSQEHQGEQSFGHTSLFLHLLEGPNVKVDCKFSVSDIEGINRDGTTKTTSGTLSTYNELGMPKFMKNDWNYLVVNRFLVDNFVLTVLCEIEIRNQNLKSFTGKIVKTETKSDASISVLKDKYDWNIKKFRSKHKKGHSVKSDDFSIQNMEKLKMYFQLWPNGRFEQESQGHVALFLYIRECEVQQHIKVQSRISIMDAQRRKRNKKWIHGKLTGSNEIGCIRYIECSNLFAQKYELLPDKFLNMNFKIEVFQEEKCFSSSSEISFDQIIEKISNSTGFDKIANLNINISNSIVSVASTTRIVGDVDIRSNKKKKFG